jgi:hypothetical protein
LVFSAPCGLAEIMAVTYECLLPHLHPYQGVSGVDGER